VAARGFADLFRDLSRVIKQGKILVIPTSGTLGKSPQGRGGLAYQPDKFSIDLTA